MPLDLAKVKAYLPPKPQQPGQPPRPQMQPPPTPRPASQQPRTGGLDIARVAAYLPAGVMPQRQAPTQARPVTPAPQAQPTGFAPPPKAPEYTKGPKQPAPTATGGAALTEGLARHAGYRLGEAIKYSEEAKKAVAEAGQGKYKDIEGLGDIFGNIGQNPYFGKAATAVGKGGGLLLNSANLLLNTGAELTERGIGQLESTTKPLIELPKSIKEPLQAVMDYKLPFEKDYEPMFDFKGMTGLRDSLKVEGDPVKEQAYQAALGITYSGPAAVRAAYNDALKLAKEGQLTPQNAEVVQAKHGNWAKELVGQVALDPFNMLDMVTVGGKVIKASKWAAGAEKMFTQPLLDKAGKLADTASVVADMGALNTKVGQLKESETLLDKALAYVNPRLTESVVHRNAQRMSQVVEIISGTTAKRALAQSGGDAVKATALAGEEFQKVAMLWADTASDDIKAVEGATNALAKLGFESIPKSPMGRRTGVILRQMMEKSPGEYGDLMSTLKLAKEQGLNAEYVAQAWYEKAAKILDNMMTPQKFETNILQRGAKKIIKARRPIDNFFGAMFLGLNPGYALRNFQDNLGRMVINNYSPLTPLSHIEQKTGFGIRGARHGIGQAEGIAGGLPATRAAEAVEKFSGRRVADQAYMDSLGSLWPKALAQLGEIPAELQPILRDFIKRDISALDNLGAKAVRPPTAAAPSIEAWRHVDMGGSTTFSDLFDKTDPHLQEYVIEALSNAKTPEDALVELRDLQRRYAEHIDLVSKTDKPFGPANGTMAGQITELTAGTGQLKQAALEKLADSLSKIEHSIRVSRSRAYVAAHQAANPDQWVGLLGKMEGEFDLTMQEILQRQMVGYTKLVSGDLDATKYAEHLRQIYIEAKNKLDAVYSQVIRAGGPEFSGTTEEITQPLMRWLLNREALAAGYPSAVVKGVAPKGVEDIFHTAYRGGEAIPDAHFYNKIRKLLREMPNADPARATAVQSLNDLSPDEMLFIINKFRETRGGLPMYTINEVLETYANRAPAAMMDFPAARPLTALPESEMADLEKLLRSTDPQVATAAKAATSVVELGFSPAGVDAAFSTGAEATQAIDIFIDEVMRRSTLPPMGLPAGLDDLLNRARQLYIETHTVAAEVARRARDFTLLDYADRRMLDPLLKVIYPWHYWYSRSIPNWAASLITRPIMGAHYMKFKRELREYNNNDPNVPEWAKEHIVARPAGYPGQIYWDFDASFNGIGNIFDTYSDPERQKDALGKMIQTLSSGGPAVHPLLVMAYAAERGLIEGDTEGMRSYGYISGLTRGFANLTGKTVEPWLWLNDPTTGKRIPWTGGASWDIEKGVRKLGYNQGKGLVGPEAAILGAATHAGPEFEAVLTNDVAQYRRLPLFLSMLTGLRVSVKQDWESEVADMNSQYTALRQAGDDEGASKLLAANPWLSTIWMSWDNEATRMKMLANNVLNRIPPMKGEDRQKILDRAGLSSTLMEQFYETTRENPDALVDWDRRDYAQFTNAILDLAELLKIPDAKTAKEWREARDGSQEMYEALDKRFPQAQEQQRTYFDTKTNQGEEAAKAYLETTNLSNYWQALNSELVKRPMVLKYYQEPAKVDSIAESMAYEEIERRHPGLAKLRQQYAQLEDFQAKREFRRLHPEVSTSYDEQKELVKQFREELAPIRASTQSGQQVPATSDYIIKGQPNATQRGVLDTIKELELEATQPVALPTEQPARFTPQEQAKFRAQDAVYAQAVQQFPQLPDLEREYQQIRQVYGKDSANLWAKQAGLFKARDAMTMGELGSPEIMRGMDDTDLDWASKVVVRQQASQMFPGIEATLDQYYALPERSKERKVFKKAHPEIGAYYDYKEKAEPFYKSQLYQHRAQLNTGGMQ